MLLISFSPHRFARIAATVLATLSLITLSRSPATVANAAVSGMPKARGGISVRLTGVPAGASEIIIQAEAPLTHIGVPKRIDFYTLATAPATGRSMTVTVPRSRLLASIAAAQHGVVNLMVGAESATRSYVRMTPARLNARGTAAVAVAGLGRISSRRPSAGRLLLPRANPRICIADQVASTEGATRLGELHVASLAGAGGGYVDGVRADNTVSVGFSETGKPGTYSSDGSLTLSNKMTSGGSFTEGQGFSKYVDGHIYYGKFLERCPGVLNGYIVQATSTPGDVFPGPRTAPSNPYGTCHADPYGFIKITHSSGFWNDDHSKAKTYRGIFTWFEFSFNGSNGFTRGVHEKWFDRDLKRATFLCGNVNPVRYPSVFWNDRS